jgi:hypothetical protein
VKNIKDAVVLFAISAVCPTAIQAAEICPGTAPGATAQIAGRVTDSRGTALPNATVTASGTANTAVADGSGNFVLTGVPLGYIAITGTLADYQFTPKSILACTDLIGQKLVGSFINSKMVLRDGTGKLAGHWLISSGQNVYKVWDDSVGSVATYSRTTSYTFLLGGSGSRVLFKTTDCSGVPYDVEPQDPLSLLSNEFKRVGKTVYRRMSTSDTFTPASRLVDMGSGDSQSDCEVGTFNEPGTFSELRVYTNAAIPYKLTPPLKLEKRQW